MAVAGCAAFSLLYNRPPHHPALEFDPLAVLFHASVVLGNIAGNSVHTALVFSFVGLTLLVRQVLCRQEWWERHAFWFGLVVFSITVALLIGISRSGFEELEIALGSRYTFLSAMFWVSVIMLHFGEEKEGNRVIAPALAFCCLSFVSGYMDVRFYLSQRRELEISAISMRLEGPPLDALRILGFAAKKQEQLLRTYHALGHYPFDGADTYDCGLIGSKLAEPILKPSGEISGYFDNATPLQGTSLYKVAGWARTMTPLRCVVIVDENDVVVGAAVTQLPRPDVNAVLGVRGENFGWEGVARTEKPELLRAIGVTGETMELHELQRVMSN
jgi:hypothetical protein